MSLAAYSAMPIKARRSLHVFYVLDTSGSMHGLPIATLNRAMMDSLLALRQVAESSGEAEVKVAVLEFNSHCRWMQEEGPEDMEDFLWEDLEAGGLTFMGAAIRELNDKLAKDKFLRSTAGIYMPVIIFMTDGYATDDYQAALDEACQNEMFREAVRVGFALGDDADEEMIAKLTGDEQAVLRTSDLELFAKLLVLVTQSASTMSITPDGKGRTSVSKAAVERARRDSSSAALSSWSSNSNSQMRVDIEGKPLPAHTWSIGSDEVK